MLGSWSIFSLPGPLSHLIASVVLSHAQGVKPVGRHKSPLEHVLLAFYLGQPAHVGIYIFDGGAFSY
ncbi:hypothetical protein LCGC14_2806240, partial [marine sediment metagenome]